MQIGDVGMWTPGLTVELLFFAAVVLLIVFGITSILVGGYYAVRVVVPSLFGRPFAAQRQRSAAATQSRHLALFAIVCGPLVSLFITLVTLPVLLGETGVGFLATVKLLFLFTGFGLLTGIVVGGAFLVSSALLGRVRKTMKKWARGGVWDADLDVMA